MKIRIVVGVLVSLITFEDKKEKLQEDSQLMLTVTILLDSVEKVQRFVSKISRYSCGFDVECGNSCVDGKSLVGLFSLDISRPLQLTVNGGESEIDHIFRQIN